MQLQIVLFYRNLRCLDNQALTQALSNGPTIGIYIKDSPDLNAKNAASLWAQMSLQKLAASLAKSKVGFKQCGIDEFKDLIASGAHVHASISNEAWYKNLLGLVPSTQLSLYQDTYLLDPTAHLTAKRAPHVVFSQFWENVKHVRSTPITGVSTYSGVIPALSITEPWQAKLLPYVKAGEDEALMLFKQFLTDKAATYSTTRDMPALQGNSGLAPYLHFGEISTRYILNALPPELIESTFHKELIWREYANYCLYYNSTLPTDPISVSFSRFPWKLDPVLFKAWKTGQTGYPLVDAGMRELWATGFMHNRVRMVTASFLVKHLMQPWQSGLQWFEECLFDHDVASNAMNWQWVSGCGIDAAPFFRIFSPDLQTKRFDNEAKYIKQWVPELKDVPATTLHKFCALTPALTSKLPITIGKDYPAPIVDYTQGRNEALAAFGSLRT